MNTLPETLVVDIVAASQHSIQAVYLFGSVGRGQERPESDIDIAVLAAAPIDPRALEQLRATLEVRLRRDVHLVDLRAASTVLRMQVVASGRVLLDRDPVGRERFEDYVFASYARLNESRRAIVEGARAEGRIYA